MKKYVDKIKQKLLQAEKSPVRLARSMALGFCIALSPFLGIQTFLIIGLSWLLRLNTVVAVIVSYTVNNPWTMVPIAAFDYVVGKWLVTDILGYDLTPYNPSWMTWVNEKIGNYLVDYLGIETLDFWAYIIGGSLVSFIITLSIYPLLMKFAQHITAVSEK